MALAKPGKDLGWPGNQVLEAHVTLEMGGPSCGDFFSETEILDGGWPPEEFGIRNTSVVVNCETPSSIFGNPPPLSTSTSSSSTTSATSPPGTTTIPRTCLPSTTTLPYLGAMTTLNLVQSNIRITSPLSTSSANSSSPPSTNLTTPPAIHSPTWPSHLG